MSGETKAQQTLLGVRLRDLRSRSELTQERAAEAIGLHVKHLQRLERGSVNVTLATLVGCSLAYGVKLGELFPGTAGAEEPFVRLPEAEVRQYKNAVPLYSLRAVAGRFGGFQQVEPLGWVATPRARTKPAPSHFVARVIGESMNLRIPPGAYCLFRAPPAPPLDGKIVVAQLRGSSDPEHGGEYTIKSYRETRRGGRVTAAELRPLSRSKKFPPIPVTPDVSVIAELVELLR